MELASDNRRPTNTYSLFHNLEDGPLTVARGGTGEQRPNGLNGLPVAANRATDIPASKLQLKNHCSAAWNFREHHVVRKFHQLPDDEFEKFSHAPKE